ncbi:hypothetical protein A9Q98_15960 [Thalassotalea sp. 42_200_T64]|nr:hypothetical protein A9Q98_15960 [Thalassotalea sp. 42_200_T64]
MANTEIQDPQLSTASAVAEEKSICSNCKAQLNGPYCAQCGQDSESTIKYFWLVMLHLLDDIFSFDSRASRTIWPLLTRPGFLTNEYILGRRVRYVPPLRLYLFISIIFFITLKFFAVSENGNLINNDESALSQVTTHISELEQQRDLLLNDEVQDEPPQSEAIQQVLQELEKFTGYQTDLGNESNKIRKAIAGELIDLEFRQINSAKPLKASHQEQYNNLTRQLAKVRNGKQVSLLNIGNNGDGTLSFPFLSEEKNTILNDFASQLEKKASKAFQSDTGPLLEQVISKLPQLMFVLLPLFAALLKIMYLFSRRFYMEHLTVALHSHSFVFFTILLLEIIDMVQDQLVTTLPWLDTSLNVVAIGLLAWIPVYLFIMQKRIYKQGYVLTTVKYAIVGMAYTGLISITAMVAFVWGLTDL